MTLWYDKKESKQKANWAEKNRSVVWNAADLAINMANVLARRMMDGARAGCKRLPLASLCTVPLKCIAEFIAGELDDSRIEELLWGLMLVNGRDEGTSAPVETNDFPGPRAYALLKLLFLPWPLVPKRSGGDVRWRLANGRLEDGLVIRPEPRILPLLRAGRVGEACRITAQRLRMSGLSPMPGPLPNGVMRDDSWSEWPVAPRHSQRLAAALLIPISSKSVDDLIHLLCRTDDSTAAKAFTLSQEGESK